MLANVDNFKEEEEPRKSIYTLVIYTVICECLCLTTILDHGRDPTFNHSAVWSQRNFRWSKVIDKATKTMWLIVIVTE